MRQRLKILLLIATAVFFSHCEKYSSVRIIDENFLEALIERGVDTDGDGTISFSEAADVKELNIYRCNIFDLTGIEWFINLETLRCGNNDFTDLDISNNPLLKELDCSSSGLTALDISDKTVLEILNCSYNHLETLDLSHNPALKTLQCDGNGLLCGQIRKALSGWLACA